MDHARPAIGILRERAASSYAVLGLLLAVFVASAVRAVLVRRRRRIDATRAPRGRRGPAVEPLPTRNPRARRRARRRRERRVRRPAPTSPTRRRSRRPAAAPAAAAQAATEGNGPTSDAAISNADVLKNGIALPPIEAPEEVRPIIEAGNQIARTPYLWGGGHGKWLDNGYDCSGSVSFALANAGLLNAPQASGPLMSWGKPGKGKWITIYSNPGHVFMVVAGVRFDTSGNAQDRLALAERHARHGGFVARHPPGL